MGTPKIISPGPIVRHVLSCRDQTSMIGNFIAKLFDPNFKLHHYPPFRRSRRALLPDRCRGLVAVWQRPTA